MYLLSNLISNLENALSNRNIYESIILRSSNDTNFDFQINNLVKFQKNNEIKDLQRSFIKLLDSDPMIKNYEFSKNYFINLEINIEMYLDNHENLIDNIKATDQKKIILDYGGPNIGKPLHVGHLRSLNIGRSLYNINKLAGHNVINDIHLGDWGMPVAQIISYISKNKLEFQNVTIENLEEIYPKASKLYQEDDDFKLMAQNINKELNENKDEVINNWRSLREISVKEIKEILSQLNHSFDLWMGESDVNNLIPKMIENLKEDKKISIDNGAYVSNLETEPKVLITKSDGSYLYLTTDLATVLNRKKESEFDKTLYIVDKRQKLHFKQLFDSIEYFGFGKEEYSHVEFGTVNDLNGIPFKTRDGQTKKLTDLFEETLSKLKTINKDLDQETNELLANTVLTFSDLITNRKTDYKFDLDKFTNISGKTGIYVQYAYVRAKKLIQDSNIDTSSTNLVFSELDESDINLLRCFLKFEYFFNQALTNNEPHHLADYLYQLSNLFNSMYQNESILENENEIKTFNKLKITHYFQSYSKLLMQSLGIRPVEKM
ncbi:arginine--tRNA ligase [Acidimicrobiaceae bacterium]|nr:arginine--tRNA ligase [Acidimicrobiaceae bacterium]